MDMPGIAESGYSIGIPAAIRVQWSFVHEHQ